MHMQGSSKTHPGCSFASGNSSNPRMGGNMPLDSSTLGFKSHHHRHHIAKDDGAGDDDAEAEADDTDFEVYGSTIGIWIS